MKYHRPRNRPRALRRNTSVIGATGRKSATSAPPEHLQPQPEEGQLGKTSAVFGAVELTAQAPPIKSAAVERQCGEDADRRSVARAAVDREPEGTWTTRGSRGRSL